MPANAIVPLFSAIAPSVMTDPVPSVSEPDVEVVTLTVSGVPIDNVPPIA